jgi:hypothetical protein
MPKYPLIALRGLVHVRIARLVGVLGRGRRELGGLDVEVSTGVALGQEREHVALQLASSDRALGARLASPMLHQLAAETIGVDDVVPYLGQAPMRLVGTSWS